MVTHIIPSGSDKTLCGLKGVPGTSLGGSCTCSDCMTKAEEIMARERKK